MAKKEAMSKNIWLADPELKPRVIPNSRPKKEVKENETEKEEIKETPQLVEDMLRPD